MKHKCMASSLRTAPDITDLLRRLEPVLRATDAALTDLSPLDLVRHAHPSPAIQGDHLREALFQATLELAQQGEEVHRSLAAEVATASEWEKRAEHALRDRREDLARQCLERQQQHQVAARRLSREQVQIERVLDQCNHALVALGYE